MVISFGYWTTDSSRGAARAFQRKICVRRDGADHWRRLSKCSVPFIVILPGLLAIAVLPVKLTGEALR